MGEVDRAQFIAWLMVVLVQAVARKSVGDDSLLGQGVIVRALKEMLRGMRVADQMCAVPGQLRAQIGAIESCEPERSGGDDRIRSADHFELEIRDDAGNRNRRMRKEGAVSEAAQ